MGLKRNILFKNNGLKGFALFYVPFLVVGLVMLIVLKHGDVVLFINQHSREEWDGTVEFITNLGLGGYIAGFMFVLVFVRIRYALMGLLSLGMVGLFTSLFKNVLFPDRIRPFNYFYYDDFFRFIYTAELNYHSSFPSGHTMAIFAAMSMLAYFIGKKSTGAFFFVFALIVGFSRIYLCQHFFLDVYIGSILGVTSTFLIILVCDGNLNFNNLPVLQKPIFKISFKRSNPSL